MGTRENKATLLESVVAFNDANDRMRYFDVLYGGDATMPGLRGYSTGLDGFKQYYTRLWAAFPDLHMRLEDMVAEGDNVSARFTVTGTHTGPLGEVQPTGKRVLFTGATFLRFRDGKCYERWGVFDQLGLMEQLTGG